MDAVDRLEVETNFSSTSNPGAALPRMQLEDTQIDAAQAELPRLTRGLMFRDSAVPESTSVTLADPVTGTFEGADELNWNTV